MTAQESPPDDGVYMPSSGYRPIQHVMAGLNSKPILLGTRGRCRFCGTTDPKKFRKDAHALPEALGNKWLFSLDECDECNNRSSRYEGELVASIGAFLTLGGVKGKANNVRQTGRTAGPAYVRHRVEDERRGLSAMINGHNVRMGRNLQTGAMLFTFPIANERFRPLDARKALLKIGYALLPDDERDQYEGLRSALIDPAAAFGASPQAVGLSFAMVGNSPPLVSVTLVRSEDPRLPRTVVVVTAGSVCLTTQLRSDAAETASVPFSQLGLQWTTHLRSGSGTDGPLAIRYTSPVYFDWSGTDTVPQPIEEFTLEFDPSTTDATFTPVFRESALVL